MKNSKNKIHLPNQLSQMQQFIKMPVFKMSFSNEIPTEIFDLPILYQTRKIEFYWEEKYDLLISLAKNFSADDEYKTNMENCLLNVRDNNIKNILFESSKFKGTSAQNQKWVAEYLIPNFVNANVERVAMIMSKEIFGQFALNNMIETGKQFAQLQIRIFDNFDEAYNWVRNIVN